MILAASCAAARTRLALGQEHQSPPGSVRGTVWDSLSNAPLALARVSLLGGTRNTLTDDRGRFVLDSVHEGRQVILWSHPSLDSLGLTGFSAAVSVLSGRETAVGLAVASHATIRRAACGAALAERSDTGLIRGVVRDAETGAPLSGAVVAYTGVLSDSADVLQKRQRGIAASSDQSGWYSLCAVPVGSRVGVRAQHRGFASDPIAVEIGPRGIARQDLTVSREGRTAAYGRVRGTVFDSLLGTPLPGAHVSVAGGIQSATTDRHGQYVLDSVPIGRQIVTFWRPDLDSIGLSSFAAAVTVEEGREATLPLAVPSHATYWRAACGSVRALGADSGVVFGRIVDAESRVPLPGAHATLTWLSISRARGGRWTVEHPWSEVEADSRGWYYVCGVPVEYLAWARAHTGPFSSGLAEVLVDLRGISRQDLSLSREELPAEGDTAAPPHRRGLATMVGTVLGERGGVLPGSVASLDDTPSHAETDSTGRFVLRNLPSGTDMLMVRRIGYFATRQLVELANRDTARVTVTLSEATVLDTLRVFASPQVARVIEEIDERRRSGFGYFKSRSEILQHNTVLSLFQEIPSLVTSGTPGNYKIALRAGMFSDRGRGPDCPRIYIDGFPADEEQLSGFTPARLVAIEVYSHESALAGKYYTPPLCGGVVLVWTQLAF